MKVRVRRPKLKQISDGVWEQEEPLFPLLEVVSEDEEKRIEEIEAVIRQELEKRGIESLTPLCIYEVDIRIDGWTVWLEGIFHIRKEAEEK